MWPRAQITRSASQESYACLRAFPTRDGALVFSATFTRRIPQECPRRGYLSATFCNCEVRRGVRADGGLRRASARSSVGLWSISELSDAGALKERGREMPRRRAATARRPDQRVTVTQLVMAEGHNGRGTVSARWRAGRRRSCTASPNRPPTSIPTTTRWQIGHAKFADRGALHLSQRSPAGRRRAGVP